MEELAQVYARSVFEVAREQASLDELRAEVERDQWLGFALTEATFFYGLVGGFIAFFL